MTASTPRRNQPKRRGTPRASNDGLSNGSPFADSTLAFTAWDLNYGGGPLADTRTWIKPATIRTRRAAVVMPADPGRVTATMTSRELRGHTR